MPVNVTQKPGEEVAADILATEICIISKAFRTLTDRSRLNRDAVVALLQDLTKLPKRTILIVLDGVADLEKRYVVPKKTA